MTLFNDPAENLLPFDGEVNYFGRIFSSEETGYYYHSLMNNIEWKNDEVIIYGKHFTTKRKAAWYGDKPFAYTYSNTTKLALPWNQDLLTLKRITEEISGATYNSCLLNLYHSGEEGMAWHSDDEKMMGKNMPIASLSFGAERRFLFKHKIHQNKIELLLENGSLLIMKGETQLHWLHRLPTTKKVLTPRINLTFRTIVA